MKIDPSVTMATVQVDSKVETKELDSIQTASHHVPDSFVEVGSEKSNIFAHPATEKLNTGSGVVTGLDVSSKANSAGSIHVTPGTGLNPFGKVVELSKHDTFRLFQEASARPNYFDGKKLNAGDLDKEQNYKKDTKHLDHALLSSTSRIAAELSQFNSALGRLHDLTGISTEQIQALLGRHGVDSRHLPNPPDQNVMGFLQDPAFSNFSQQDLLKALYGR